MTTTLLEQAQTQRARAWRTWQDQNPPGQPEAIIFACAFHLAVLWAIEHTERAENTNAHELSRARLRPPRL